MNDAKPSSPDGSISSDWMPVFQKAVSFEKFRKNGNAIHEQGLASAIPLDLPER